MITVDDGYRASLTNALPLLEKYRMTATIFLLADPIGQEAARDAASGPPAPLLGGGEVRDMADHGIGFGAPGAMHLPLTGLGARELRADPERSAAALARIRPGDGHPAARNRLGARSRCLRGPPAGPPLMARPPSPPPSRSPFPPSMRPAP